MKDLISIIIPVHNSEKYLKKCLESVINQTYVNLEIILINDASTDNSEKICKEYCLKDNRIKLFNNCSGSAGLSRNYGLEKSNGKYVIFIDSDDYIELNMCEKLYKTIVDNYSDVCFCGYNIVDKTTKNRVFMNGKKIQNYSKSEIENSVINNTIYVYSKKNQLPLYAVWNGIYNLEIINKNSNRFLNENKYFSEDSIFNYEYLRNCSKITIINDALYNHTIYNKDSICNRYNERYNCIDDWYNYIIDISKKKKTEGLIKVLNERYVTISVSRIKQEVLLSKKNVNEKLSIIKKIINNHILEESLKNINMNYKNRKQKILLFLIKHKFEKLIYIFIKLRTR